jgi:arylsulfatase A-like enzyme
VQTLRVCLPTIAHLVPSTTLCQSYPLRTTPSPPTSYGAVQYTQHHLQTIEAFASTGAEALFIYAPFQNTHEPYEVPPPGVGHVNSSVTQTESKQTMFAMISVLDQAVANMTAALVAKDLWSNTLLVFSADNGGEQGSAGNNWPYRGGKYTDFEGGVKVTAFASGGVIPVSVSHPIPHTHTHIIHTAVH